MYPAGSKWRKPRQANSNDSVKGRRCPACQGKAMQMAVFLKG